MKKTALSLSILVAAVILSGCNTQEAPVDDTSVEVVATATPVPTMTVPVTDTADSITDTGDSVVAEPATQTYGEYVEYSDRAFDESADTFRVLFFHASWCPTCKVAHEDFTTNIEDIPTNVTILKTDYDTETGLKDQYGITYQHTFVLLDKDGSVMDTWNGGGLDELKQHLTVF